MKKILILLFCCICAQALGQANHKSRKKNKDAFVEQTEQINALLKKYGTLSPFSGNEAELIDSLGTEITTRLVNVLNDKRILNYLIEKLFTEEELMITKSDDSKIYFFSIDEKTGGSYKTNKTILFYKLSNGTVNAELLDEDELETLATASYGQIYTLDSTNQIYLVLGDVQTCNSCLVSLAFTLQLGTDSIDRKVIAEYNGGYPFLEVFDYTSDTKEFNFEYIEIPSEDSPSEEDTTVKGRVHRFKNKFKFEDGNFVPVEKCEFWEKKAP